MPRAQLRVELSGDAADPWGEHPDIEFNIPVGHRTEEGLLGVAEAEVSDPASIVRTFEAAPGVRSSEVLHADERTVVIKFLIPEPTSYRALVVSGNLPRFPLSVRDGWVRCEITTSRSRLSRLQDRFEAAGVTFEVLSVTQSSDPTDVLTDRQRQFVSEALERGYYDTPRRCSLTDLADVLDTSKSTASVVLHGAEERMVKSFMGEPVE